MQEESYNMTGKEKIGFLFPGQGAQFVGMGKDLCEAHAEARRVFEQASDILKFSISKLCFEGPETELTRTLYAQPGIYVTSYAAFKVINAVYPELAPSFAAGLSLGEFTALTAVGAISFEEGLKLVQIRAEAMESAARNNPGTMASIMGMDSSACAEVARESGCEVANLNSPDQTVVSGTQESIERACRLAEERGAKRAIPLKVGGAFHSSLMREAGDRLRDALRRTSITHPSCVFVPNAKASPVSDPEEIRDLLARQLTSPVRWVETMNEAAQSNARVYLEVGPGRVLKGLAKKCQPGLQVYPCGIAAEIASLDSQLNQTEAKS